MAKIKGKKRSSYYELEKKKKASSYLKPLVYHKKKKRKAQCQFDSTSYEELACVMPWVLSDIRSEA